MPIPQTLDQCKQVLQIKRVGSNYLQQLINIGIPSESARMIAVAIAKYDVAQCHPEGTQRQLISHYSALVCRANLWRPGLLSA